MSHRTENGLAILWVQTDNTRVELQITPKGRKITVREGLAPIRREPQP